MTDKKSWMPLKDANLTLCNLPQKSENGQSKSAKIQKSDLKAKSTLGQLQ